MTREPSDVEQRLILPPSSSVLVGLNGVPLSAAPAPSMAPVRLAPVRRYTLATVPGPMATIPGRQYSTEPRTGVCRSSGRRLVVKAPHSVVAAECAGYALAELVGIEVPAWGVAVESKNRFVFISEQEDVRDVLPYLEAGTVSNRDLLDRLLVFDLWIVNVDRNDESLVGRPALTQPPGAIELRSIDFEKARILQSAGIIEVGQLHASHMLPRGRLQAQAPRRSHTLQRMIERIQDVTEAQLRAALTRSRREGELVAEVPELLDIDRTVSTLLARAMDLP